MPIDPTIKPRPYAFGSPVRRTPDAGVIDPIDSKVPNQFDIITTDYLDTEKDNITNAAWAAAMTLGWGDGTASNGDVTSTTQFPDRFSSWVTQPISAIADLAFGPTEFSLAVYERQTSETKIVKDPSISEYGGGFTAYLSALRSSAGAGLGANAVDHYPNAIMCPQWAWQPGQALNSVFSNIPVPDLGGIPVTLSIGLSACRVPSVSDLNPKLGAYEYTNEEVVVGFKLQPETVAVDPITGDLVIQLANHKLLCENPLGFTQLNHTGRRCLVYAKTPTATTGIAIQETTMTFVGGTNTVIIPGGLGAGTSAPTAVTDYFVVILGPIVTDWDFIFTNYPASFPGGIAIVGQFRSDPGGVEAWYKDPATYPTAASYQNVNLTPTFDSISNPVGFLLSKTITDNTSMAGPAPTTAAVDQVYRIRLDRHPNEDIDDLGVAIYDDTGTLLSAMRMDGILFATGDIVTDGKVIAPGGFTNNNDPGASNSFSGTVQIEAGTVWQSDANLVMGTSAIAWSDVSVTNPELENLGVVQAKPGAAWGTVESRLEVYPFLTGAVIEEVVLAVKGPSTLDPTDALIESGQFIARDNLAFNASANNARFTIEGGGAYTYTGKKSWNIKSASSMIQNLFVGNQVVWPLYLNGTGFGVDVFDHYVAGFQLGGVDYPAAVKCGPGPGGDFINFPVPLRLLDGQRYAEVTATFTPRFPAAGLSWGEIAVEFYFERPDDGTPPAIPGVFQPPADRAWEVISLCDFGLGTGVFVPFVPNQASVPLTISGNDIVVEGNQASPFNYWMMVYIEDSSSVGESTLLHNLALDAVVFETPTQLCTV